MNSNEDFDLFIKALDFSAYKHRNQLRKGEDKTPYINHPIQVARLLWENGESSPILLAGALLHDTIEDTETTYQELVAIFGEQVANLVKEVTDNKELDYKERKRLQVVNAKHKSHEAKLLKLADKTCNVRDLTQSPPQNWSNERKMQYLSWAEEVVSGLRGENQKLESIFDEWIEIGKNKLQEKSHETE